MKKWRWFGKIVALGSSVLLLGGYVFVRAGGKLWPTATGNAPPQREPVVLSASKSLELGPASSVQPPTEGSQRGAIMYGSKSARVFGPEDSSQSVPPQPESPASNHAQTRRSQP